ncbi:polyribonucleotide nucleotidyltransferase [bacterium]|nr:polyribonucleotide nucleotidyltransferase [bacterium]
MISRKTMELGRLPLTLEVGRVAKQADGTCWLTYGDTVILATVVANLDIQTELDFLPMSVDYREKLSAAGRIPGGFFRREGRPSEKEILSARLIDRPIRPLFPDGFHCEIQVMVSVLSSDGEIDPDVLGAIAASTALSVSEIPFQGPIASIRMGLVDNEYIINPTYDELKKSRLDLVISGSESSIIMVEGEAREVSDDTMIEAIGKAHDVIRQVISLQKELIAEAGKPKFEFTPKPRHEELDKKLEQELDAPLREAVRITEKQERRTRLHELQDNTILSYAEEYPEEDKYISSWIHDQVRDKMRTNVLRDGSRLDGRSLTDIREIDSAVALLPRVHGSALFTRGQTQALGMVTLGTKYDEQKIDSLEGVFTRPFMLHYNFPPYSVGEIRKFLGQSRREVGHGNLAWRALHSMLPDFEEFPYTIRIVSDVLESNGSSSMATVCAGSLSLMDAGVPIQKPVAGIAMGLIKEGEKTAILSDILGDEDHLGDMDFKVAGTRDGITACQMDIKIEGISSELMRQALAQARVGINHILDKMSLTLEKPRPEISPFAPRILFLKIDPDKIGFIIGPGGKTIRDIIERTGARIDIEDDGTVCIASTDTAQAEAAVDIIEKMLEVPEVGKVYHGIVKRITDFGAFVEILPGRDGLLHISEIEHRRIRKVSDHLQLGDEVDVKLLKIDDQGKLDLSRKALLPKDESDGKPFHRPETREKAKP